MYMLIINSYQVLWSIQALKYNKEKYASQTLGHGKPSTIEECQHLQLKTTSMPLFNQNFEIEDAEYYVVDGNYTSLRCKPINQ